MMNNLFEGLAYLKRHFGDMPYMGYKIDNQPPQAITINEGILEPIEKHLKALEIIRNKSVNVRNLITYGFYCFETKKTYEDYIELFDYADEYFDLGRELLTQEEYELLREVLL